MNSRMNANKLRGKHNECIDRIAERLSYLDPSLNRREHGFDIDGKHGELDYLIIHHTRALLFEAKASMLPKRLNYGIKQLNKAEKYIRHNFPFVDKVTKFYVRYHNGENNYYRIK